LLAYACSGEKPGTDFLARVGSSLLTEEDLPSHQGDQRDSLSFRQNFVNEWIATELLFQEAVRRGLAESEEIRRSLESARKRMAVNALLNEELFEDTAATTSQSVEEYFAAHQQQFMLREDVALASFARFDDRDVANSFRSRILRGSSWSDALSLVQHDPLLSPHLLQVFTRRYATRSELYPEQLWKVARTLKKEKVSFVITTDVGHFVLLLHDFKTNGTLPDLAYVGEEIRERMQIDIRRQHYDALLQELRSRFPVEVRLEAPEPPTGESPSE
jgi:hypothetical protein